MAFRSGGRGRKSIPEASGIFCAPFLIAQRRVTADPALLYAEAQKRLGIDEPTARAIGDSHLRAGIWNPNGGLTAVDVQDTIDFLVKAEALPPGLTITQVSNLSYLDDVLTEIGRAGNGPSAGRELTTGTPSREH